jgi:DNA modification methylase
MTDPYYRDDWCTIYHGDCRDVLPGVVGVADLVLTDPPYNAKKVYDIYRDDLPADEYEAWCASWWPLCRQAAPRAVLFPGHGNIGMWYRIDKPSAVGCWFKPGNGASSIIGFEEWEPWLYWHGGNKGLLGGSSVIRQPLDTSGNEMAARAGHPCPKPVALMAKLVRKTRTESLVDPFMGSGTSLRAAKDNGVRSIGIELSERYCEIAAKRLAQEVLDFGGAA